MFPNRDIIFEVLFTICDAFQVLAANHRENDFYPQPTHFHRGANDECSPRGNSGDSNQSASNCNSAPVKPIVERRRNES
jgi:hypothetical protein